MKIQLVVGRAGVVPAGCTEITGLRLDAKLTGIFFDVDGGEIVITIETDDDHLATRILHYGNTVR